MLQGSRSTVPLKIIYSGFVRVNAVCRLELAVSNHGIGSNTELHVSCRMLCLFLQSSLEELDRGLGSPNLRMLWHLPVLLQTNHLA